MKKAIIQILLLAFSMSVFAQKYELCHIIKTDNSILKGKAKRPQMFDKTFKFEKRDKKIEFTFDEIKELQFFEGTDTLKYRPIITYKNYGNKKVNKRPSWLRVEKEGAVDLYFGYQEKNMEPYLNMWYLKKKEDETAYFIAVKYSLIIPIVMTLGHNTSFEKNAAKYLSDYSELSQNIKDGAYKLKDIETVVDIYNSWKEKQ